MITVILETKKKAELVSDVWCNYCDTPDRPGFSTFSEQAHAYVRICLDCIQLLHLGAEAIDTLPPKPVIQEGIAV